MTAGSKRTIFGFLFGTHESETFFLCNRIYQEELRTIDEFATRDTEQRTMEDAGNFPEELALQLMASKEVHQGPPAVPPRRRLSLSSSGHSAATLGGTLEEAARSTAKTSEGERSLEKGRVSEPEINSAVLPRNERGEETLALFKGGRSMLSPAVTRAQKKVLNEMWRDTLEPKGLRMLCSSASSTDKWEVPRERLYVRDIIGVGAFGEVRRAVLQSIGGISPYKMVAVKIMKGTSFTCLIQSCVCLISSVLNKKGFFFQRFF